MKTFSSSSSSTSSARERAGWSHAGVRWLLVVVGVLLASGWLLHALDPAALAEGSDAERALHRGANVLHGAFAWAFCMLLGRWIWPHVALSWARGATRRSTWVLGLGAAGTGAVAALSGLGLLYGTADWRDALSALHWAIGLGWPLLCVLHAWRRVAVWKSRIVVKPAVDAARVGAEPGLLKDG